MKHKFGKPLMKFIIGGAIFLPALFIVSMALLKKDQNSGGTALNQEKEFKDAMLSTIDKWSALRLVNVRDIKRETFRTGMVVQSEVVDLKNDKILKLKDTVFDLIKAYNSNSSDDYLKFWAPYDWVLDSDSSSYLMDIAGQGHRSEDVIKICWSKIMVDNRIVEISPDAIFAAVDYTSDVGAFVSKKFPQDIMYSSSVTLPAGSAMLLSRSVFNVKPLSSAIIEKDGKVLYARVVLYVSYFARPWGDKKIVLPLAFGLYWNSDKKLWVPHVKGSTSALTKFGIIY